MPVTFTITRLRNPIRILLASWPCVWLIIALLGHMLPFTTHAQSLIWANSLRSINGNYDFGTSVKVDASGNIYTTGMFQGTVDFDPGAGTYNLTSTTENYDVFVSKLDASGNLVWARNVGGTGNDYGQALTIDGSGNVYTTGYFEGTADFNPGTGTTNLIAAGGYDIFLSKLDASGNFVWAKRMGGTLDDRGFSITVDASSNVYTTGYFTSTADFDPGAGTSNLASASNSHDTFVSKLNASGDFVWAKSLSGNGNEQGNSIAVDASGNVYTTGFFWGFVDFDPGAGTANMISRNTGNATVVNDIFVSKLDASGNYVWAKNMGGSLDDIGTSITVDASGNVYTTGYFQTTADFDPGTGTTNLTSAGSYDIFVSKLDASGNFVWAKSAGGVDGDFGYSLTVDGSGNVYTTGVFQGTVDFDPGAGTSNLTTAGLYDIFVSKLDASGTFVWAKSMGGGYNDFSYSIAVDASGNVHTTGYFTGTVDFDPGAGTANLVSVSTAHDLFINKLNASGNYVWAKSLSSVSTTKNEGKSIAVDASGNVYMTGAFQGTVDVDPSTGATYLSAVGSYDIAISKFSTSGTVIWAKGMGGTGSDEGKSVAVDAAGNVYTTGYFDATTDFDPGSGTTSFPSAGGHDIFISKLDALGNFVWAKNIGGTNNDIGDALAVDASGNVYLTGYFTGTVDFDPGAGTSNLISAGGSQDLFVCKLDASGNFVWARNLGSTGSDEGRSIAIDASGNVYTTGYFTGTVDFDPGAGTSNLTSAGGYDIFVSKLDASGNFVWAKGMGGTDNDMGVSLAVDGSGNTYTTGSFGATADFDPGAGTATLTSAGGIDIFMSKLDASGNFVWAKSMGGASDDLSYSLGIDAVGGVYTTGYFAGTADFDPGAGTTNLTSAGANDIFISKLNALGNLVAAKSLGSSGDDISYAVVADGSGNVHLTGTFAGTVDFDPGAGTTNLSATGSGDTFISKLGSVALPVTIHYFNGRHTPQGNLLGWETVREDNNAHFQIERSRDALAFEAIATIISRAEGGNSVQPLPYTYLDASPLPGVNYYRLSQTDRNGIRTNHKIIALSQEGQQPVLYPNPVGTLGQAQLEPAIAYTSYQLSDMQGRVVTQVREPGTLNILSVGTLPAGVYLLRVEQRDGQVKFFKLVKLD